MLLICALALLRPVAATGSELGLPADCTVGETCFFQQLPDMDPGPGHRDPFCSGATYDGHKGTDLRVVSMADVARGVPVTAVADGTVLRIRDGESDRLIGSEAERASVAGKECGNGIVIGHPGGLETQYCHLRRGSVSVRPGQGVQRGEAIAEIGASGLAQFPHVHLGVRLDGRDIDPLSGQFLSEGCLKDASLRKPLFAPDIVARIPADGTSLLGLGLAGDAVSNDDLVAEGPPPAVRQSSAATVGWAWFANLHPGDRVRLLVRVDDRMLVDYTAPALERWKADFVGYAGKSRAPAPGRYEVTVSLLREGKTALTRTRTLTVD